MADRTYTVYVIYCSATGKEYIGATGQSLSRRWHGHISRARQQETMMLSDAINEFGPKAFSIHPIATFKTRAEADQVERETIAERKTIWPNGYNVAFGAMGNPGYPASEKRKANLRATWQRRGGSFTGRKHTDETKAVLREKALTRPYSHMHTPEAIAKRVATWRANGSPRKPVSDATRAKMSANNGHGRWINDGVRHARIDPSAPLPDGWSYGRLFTHRKKRNSQ